LTSLSNYPLVLPNAPNAIRGLLDSVLGKRGVQLNVLAEVARCRPCLALVAEGMAARCCPKVLWRPALGRRHCRMHHWARRPSATP